MQDVGLKMIMSKSSFGHLMLRTDSFKKTLMLGMMKAGGKGDDR